jgi:hypothetical protein
VGIQVQSILEKVEKKEMPADSTSNLVFAFCLLLLLLFIERHPLYTLNPYQGEVTLLSAIYEQREEVSMDRVLSEPNPESYDITGHNG